jgi:hypothetical protein
VDEVGIDQIARDRRRATIDWPRRYRARQPLASIVRDVARHFRETIETEIVGSRHCSEKRGK